MSGFADRNGFPDREPVLPPIALADMAAGLYGAMAVLIAQREREVKGGAGQVIDLSLLEPVFSILGADAAGYRVDGSIKQRAGSASNTASPRNVYATKDGKWVALSASIQSMAERVFRVVGREDAIGDPRFRNNAQRVRHRTEVDAIIGGWVAERSLNEALAELNGAGVTAGPVYDIAQFLDDPHVIEREVVVDLPDEDVGTVPVHNILPRLSRTPGTFRYAAPKLGAAQRRNPGRRGRLRRRVGQSASERCDWMTDQRKLPVWRSLLYVPANVERFRRQGPRAGRRRHHP